MNTDALELEWDSNFALPVANAENKLLEEAINKKTLDRNQYQSEFEEHRNKALALKDHIKYVKDELNSAQVKEILHVYRKDSPTVAFFF